MLDTLEINSKMYTRGWDCGLHLMDESLIQRMRVGCGTVWVDKESALNSIFSKENE